MHAPGLHRRGVGEGPVLQALPAAARVPAPAPAAAEEEQACMDGWGKPAMSRGRCDNALPPGAQEGGTARTGEWVTAASGGARRTGSTLSSRASPQVRASVGSGAWRVGAAVGQPEAREAVASASACTREPATRQRTGPPRLIRHAPRRHASAQPLTPGARAPCGAPPSGKGTDRRGRHSAQSASAPTRRRGTAGAR